MLEAGQLGKISIKEAFASKAKLWGEVILRIFIAAIFILLEKELANAKAIDATKTCSIAPFEGNFIYIISVYSMALYSLLIVWILLLRHTFSPNKFDSGDLNKKWYHLSLAQFVLGLLVAFSLFGLGKIFSPELSTETTKIGLNATVIVCSLLSLALVVTIGIGEFVSINNHGPDNNI